MAEGQFLSVRDVAGLWHVSEKTVKREIARGHLAGVRRIGRQIRIPAASLDQPPPPPAPPEPQPLVTVTIPMHYPGDAISKNHMFIAGNRKNGLTREAKDWRDSLVDFVRLAFISEGARACLLPVTVELLCRFARRGRNSDPQNFIELVSDAVQDGTGVNDSDFKIVSYPPEFGEPPEILVRVTARIETRD